MATSERSRKAQQIGANGDAIVGALVAAKRFHQAAEVANDLVPGRRLPDRGR